MNPKILGGFLLGAVGASILTYAIMQKTSQPAPAPPRVSVSPAPAVVQAETPAPVTPVETKLPEPKRPVHAVSKAALAVSKAATNKVIDLPAAAPPPAPVEVAKAAPAQVPEIPAPVETKPEPKPEPAAAAPRTSTEAFRPLRPDPPRISSEPAQPNTVTLPSGTSLTVRLGERISSDRSAVGDTFFATLDQPIVINGFVIADRGSRAEGRVAEVEQAGRVKGLARLVLELTRISTTDGQKVDVATARVDNQAQPSTAQDAAKVGVGAALGAIIGAAAGGGKGAAIGAAAGGAAGAGTVAATRGKPVVLDTETRLSFRLERPVTIVEQLNQ